MMHKNRRNVKKNGCIREMNQEMRNWKSEKWKIEEKCTPNSEMVTELEL